MAKANHPLHSGRRQSAYTRRVRLLKLGLPLIALGILSSLFLFSRQITMEGALPYAEVDIADRLREPKMTEVSIATAADNGARILVTANEVLVPQTNGEVTGTQVSGRIESLSGAVTSMIAAQIFYDDKDETAALTGGVQVQTWGYDITTEALDMTLQTAALASRGAVRAAGPLGQLDAGQMSARQTDDGVVIVFTSGVKLLYTPKN